MDIDKTINSVKVLSIDEERRKFRVIFTTNSAAANDTRFGKFNFNLPPPTSLTNSDHFQNARIKIEYVCATPDGGVSDPTWVLSTNTGVGIHQGGVIVRLNTPCQQVVRNKIFTGAEYGTGTIDHNGFLQFVPMELKNVGSLLANAAGPAGAGVPQRTTISWIGDGTGAEGMITANPFNQNIELSLMSPSVDFATCYLASATAGGGLANPLGVYTVQFIVEMIPNK
tara:strand:- start:44 stop:721 length:678 start_codon:yes stop_codon:yes gene_type:complete